jgi:hypothetical protein
MAAEVAETHRDPDGALVFRVLTDLPGLGIVYVRREQNGDLSAETFGGRPLREVPAEARTAVQAWLLRQHDREAL